MTLEHASAMRYHGAGVETLHISLAHKQLHMETCCSAVIGGEIPHA